MNQKNAENLFITLEWIKEQTGKDLEKLPEVSTLKDGRYKTEICLPTIGTLFCCAGQTKLEAMERLFENAHEVIEEYCKQRHIQVPTTFISDKLVFVEEDGEVKLALN